MGGKQMSYYDFDGKPIDSDKWQELYYPIEQRQFGRNKIGKFRVSTVWLGLNYNFNPNGKPLIFETMIFDESKNSEDVGCLRYSTKEEALAGHQGAIKWAKKRRWMFWEKGYWSG
jgi:hypothetical protein